VNRERAYLEESTVRQERAVGLEGASALERPYVRVARSVALLGAPHLSAAPVESAVILERARDTEIIEGQERATFSESTEGSERAV
jgi:hypothetical protein